MFAVVLRLLELEQLECLISMHADNMSAASEHGIKHCFQRHLDKDEMIKCGCVFTVVVIQ